MQRTSYELVRTSDGHWNVVAGGSTLIVGTIMQRESQYDLRDAQNLDLGRHLTLHDAVDALATI